MVSPTSRSGFEEEAEAIQARARGRRRGVPISVAPFRHWPAERRYTSMLLTGVDALVLACGAGRGVVVEPGTTAPAQEVVLPRFESATPFRVAARSRAQRRSSLAAAEA